MTRDIKELHPYVQKLARDLIGICKEYGITVYLCRTFISDEEQEELYAIGRTVPGKIVTYSKPGYSLHNYGLAFDIVCSKDDMKDENDILKLVGKLGRSIGLTWKGDEVKKLVNLNHFEWSGGLTVRDLLSGKLPTE